MAGKIDVQKVGGDAHNAPNHPNPQTSMRIIAGKTARCGHRPLHMPKIMGRVPSPHILKEEKNDGY